MDICYNFDKYNAEAGVDEAGRGALAGPVCVSAVILPKYLDTPKEITIKDSKKLSEKKRKSAAAWIKENATSWSCVFISADDVDRLNILNATLLGMRRSIEELEVTPDFITVDGIHYQPEDTGIAHVCIPQGDDKYRNIAAASIIAKTSRDSLMEQLHLEFPVYNWAKNKAYGTAEHREAIEANGITRYHRKSFKH